MDMGTHNMGISSAKKKTIFCMDGVYRRGELKCPGGTPVDIPLLLRSFLYSSRLGVGVFVVFSCLKKGTTMFVFLFMSY